MPRTQIPEDGRRKVFVSYSHKDSEWLERLQVHITDLERRGLVELWDDTKIQPGAHWRQEISDALASASVAVLLVSADFIASDFIAENELPPLLAAAENEGVVILPLILSPSLFETMENLARFQSINPPSKSLIGLNKVEQEAFLVKLSKAILSVVEKSAKKPGLSQTATAVTLKPPRRKFDWRLAAAAAVALIAVIAGLFWWSLPDQALPSSEMVIARPVSQPASGAITVPANSRIYDSEASFPTGKPPQDMVYVTIGFTVWRTRPTTARDGEDVARETIDSQEIASERIAETIADGDRIYLGIESLTGEFLPDKGGYLYVINREQYADGTFGRARLIFPTLLTYEGKNRVKPGQPIVLPEKNRPFIIKRSGSAQVAETYTIILSPVEFRLPDTLSNKALVLPDNLVADWEKQYGGRMYRATLRGGVGQTRTKREQTVGVRATVDDAEPLTQDEPLPQNCYRSAVKIGSPALMAVTLRFKD